MGFFGNTSSNEDDLFGSHPGTDGPSLFTDPGKFTGVLNAYKPLYQQALATDGDPVQGMAQAKMVNLSGGGQTGQPSGHMQGASVAPLNAPGEKPFGENDRIREKKRQLEQGAVREGEAGPMNEPYDSESDAVRGKNWRFLSPEEKERLKTIHGERVNLDDIKLHIGEAPWFMPSDKRGIALENHIYINDKNFDPSNSLDDFGDLVHETTHVKQFQFDGMTRPGYLWEALKDGYRGNEYEKEAYDIGDAAKLPSTKPINENDLNE